MRIRVQPGAPIGGETTVPGDKSIAHRWLILAATADGTSLVAGLPPSLDVRSTASCLAHLSPRARPALDLWARKAVAPVEGGRSTWNVETSSDVDTPLEVEAEGRAGLGAPEVDLDCGNSGTTMRLLAGVLAASPFESVLVGDPSLSSRPMERVAAPLRAMGAGVETSEGHAPLRIAGGRLRGIRYETGVPSAQVKSALLLAGTAAEGTTTVVETAPTRDHTERALAALGAPLTREGTTVHISHFQHGGLRGRVPGDPSSGAFLLVAAALTGGSVTIRDVGLNPSRLRYLDVMRRMGLAIEVSKEREEVGEPVGSIRAHAPDALAGTVVDPEELPLVIDEVPVLGALAAHARDATRFLRAAELRVKESDRLRGLVDGIRSLGGDATVEGDDLVVTGGGLAGGTATAGGDHRMAMALCVAAVAAREACEIDGVESADVSFPGFVTELRALGAAVEVVG
jgi:3-phosphoshikimate 1-carboxyvinyltransferase